MLRLENLNLENGPDLRVYLVSIDPVPNGVSTEAIAGYADLGQLKGNVGNQNYEIPERCGRFAIQIGLNLVQRLQCALCGGTFNACQCDGKRNRKRKRTRKRT